MNSSSKARILRCAVVLLALLAGPAHAQFDAQAFRPDPDGLGGIAVSSSRTVRPGTLVLGLFGNYAVDPVSAELATGTEPVTTDLSTVDLLATVGLAQGWEAGLDLPVSIIRNVAFAEELDDFTGGLGDVVLFTKWAPLSRDRGPFGVAFDLNVILPTGDEDNFLGAEGLGVDAGVIVDGKLGPIGAAARIGYLLRDEDLGLGDALAFEAGIAYEGNGNAFRPLLELHGSSTLDDFGSEEGSPVEAILGFRWAIPLAGLEAMGGPARGLVLSSGVGFGLNDGIGSPSVRGMLGLSALTGGSREKARRDGGRARSEARRPAAPRATVPDADGDGIPDAVDICPRAAENRDGHLDRDGCPDVGGPGVQAAPVFRATAVSPEASDREVVPVRPDAPGAVAAPLAAGELERFAPIRFASDGSSVAPGSRGEIDRLHRVLAANPTLQVRLIGHADASGAAERNVVLSVDRAVRVEQELVRRGIDRGRIVALGVGDVEPVATNTTPQGRAQNRRVEVFLELPR